VYTLDDHWLKLAEWVWAQHECVVQPHHALEQGTGHNSAHTRHGERVVDLELGRACQVTLHPGGEKIKEHLQEIHVLSRHVGHLKDRTHPARKTKGINLFNKIYFFTLK